MKRNLGALADRELDVLVVGGGVYGAAIAWDASLRGLDVGLIERKDFGSGTSFNNLKTIHGGIRYLQHLDVKRIRESIRERRVLMRIAPHLVHPLPFVVPTYEGSVTRGRTALRMAVFLNDAFGWDRNRDLEGEKHLPPGRVLSREECLGFAPGLDPTRLTGGVLWYDAQMYNSDRVTLSFVLSAAENGASIANHVEATDFLREGSKVTGVLARDVSSGAEELPIRSRVVVNASGPWVDGLLGKLEGRRPRLFHFSKATNLVTRRLMDKAALGINHGGRLLVIAPWRDVSLVGTSHAFYQGEPDELEATEGDVEDLLRDVNEAYPEARLRREDVRLIHRGLLPMVPARENGAGITLAKSYRIEDHRASGVEGLVSVVGVKYTTARDVAEKTVGRVMELLGRPGVASRSASTPVVGGDFEGFEALVESAPLPHLAYNYGSRFREIEALGPLEPLASTTHVTGNEVRHAVRNEMACDLESVVLRRTELGSAGHPGREALERAAEVVAEELSWSAEKKSAELDEVEAFYRIRS